VLDRDELAEAQRVVVAHGLGVPKVSISGLDCTQDLLLQPLPVVPGMARLLASAMYCRMSLVASDLPAPDSPEMTTDWFFFSDIMLL
jgi:hypothetical protein